VSRSGYSDDYDLRTIGLWRASVDRAIDGKRGQAFLREMAAALDAMPEKVLIADEIRNSDGDVCAIGSVGAARNANLDLDAHAYCEVAAAFGIARALAQEIAYENDECGPRKETPAQRWTRMREWVACQLRESGEP
jgi:hypothetical protein